MIRSIGVFTANRAEKGLLEPVYAALKQTGFTVAWMNIPQGDSLAIIVAAEETYKLLNTVQFDFAIVPCDRQEMAGVALVLFSRTVPFAQFHGGDVGSGTHDEVYRWIISRCASIHFTNSPESAQNLVKSGEESWRIHLVGSTAFDGIEIDESLCPEVPFSLVLLHPDTFSKESTLEDLGQTKSKMTIWSGLHNPWHPEYVIIGSNKDRYHELIDETWQFYAEHYPNQVRYFPEGVPRAQFLGLMKQCREFITNSSSALYELPAFDITKWVNIGKRNADRKPLEHVETGGAKRIAEILKNLDVDTLTLLRKKFTV